MNNEYKETIKRGDTIKFGSYPQSTDIPEPIEWDVLDVVDGKALLFAHKILDAHIFDKESNNYANSEIRTWLNNEFLNKAFTEEEQERILITEVDNSTKSTKSYHESDDDLENHYACENTKDKIFLLSEYEITNPNYGFNEDPYDKDIKRRKQVTAYTKKNGAFIYDETVKDYESKYKGNGYFFLRSPSFGDDDYSFIVHYSGYSNIGAEINYNIFGIVPVLWIKI